MEKRKPYTRKVEVTGGLWDAYKLFKEHNPHTTITRKQYVDVCHLFNKKLSNKIITESLEFRGFWGIGFFRIKTFKMPIHIKDGKIDTSKNKVDWYKTKQLWAELYPGKTSEELHAIPNKKLVIHLNEHSNGYAMRWYWDQRTCLFKNKSVYGFKPVKGGISKDGYYYGRQGLAAWIKSEDRTNDYYL